MTWWSMLGLGGPTKITNEVLYADPSFAEKLRATMEAQGLALVQGGSVQPGDFTLDAQADLFKPSEGLGRDAGAEGYRIVGRPIAGAKGGWWRSEYSRLTGAGAPRTPNAQTPQAPRESFLSGQQPTQKGIEAMTNNDIPLGFGDIGKLIANEVKTTITGIAVQEVIAIGREEAAQLAEGPLGMPMLGAALRSEGGDRVAALLVPGLWLLAAPHLPQNAVSNAISKAMVPALQVGTRQSTEVVVQRIALPMGRRLMEKLGPGILATLGETAGAGEATPEAKVEEET